MTDMTVVHLETSGQILAAVAPTTPFGEPPTVTDLVGENLIVRGSTVDDPEVLIPPEDLALATLGFERAVLADPMAYRHRDGEAAALGGLVEALTDVGGRLAVSVDRTPQDLDASVTTPPQVWVYTRDGTGGSPQVSTATLDVDATTSGVLVPPLPAGPVEALAVVDGYRSAVLAHPPS